MDNNSEKQKEQEKIRNIFRKAEENFHNEVRSWLIDKSITDEEIDKKYLCNFNIAEKYGLFLPNKSASNFMWIEQKMESRNNFIIKPFMPIARLKYLFYINYIKRQQRKLRKQVQHKM